ncbi:VOC family protein [Microbacterium sp. NPDC057659]|uniref:VOC family protein n=1 Tax=Microbacterium sp. NPDC057659 TaxID=3346198 RepID=UPI0036718DC8
MAVLNPYLSFRDNAREAMTFYQSVLGGKLDLVEFSSFPQMPQDPGDANKIMHSWLATEDGMVLAGSDTPKGMEYQEPQGISVSVSTQDDDRAQAIWDGLADGGTVGIPFESAPWGGRFGMVTDRYGISWMLSVDAME